MAVTFSGKDKVQKYARAWLNGYDISGDTRTFNECQNMLEEIDMSGWSDDLMQWAGGMRSVAIRQFEALMNDDAGRSLDVLQTPNTNMIAVIAFGGGGEPAVGDPSYHMIGRLIGSTAALNGGRALIRGDIPGRAGVDFWENPLGRILQPASTLSASLDQSSVDWGVDLPRTNGASATLQILSSSSGDFTFKVQDSTNDSVWADLITFTLDGSAVGSEYQLLAPGTTIDRYTRFQATRVAGSCVAVVTFALNNVFQTV